MNFVQSRVNGMLIPISSASAGVIHRFGGEDNSLVFATEPNNRDKPIVVKGTANVEAAASQAEVTADALPKTTKTPGRGRPAKNSIVPTILDVDDADKTGGDMA